MSSASASSGGSVVSLIDAVNKHSKFKALAAYSMTCVAKAVDPRDPSSRETARALIRSGGVAAISSVLSKHPADADVISSAASSLNRLAHSSGNAKVRTIAPRSLQRGFSASHCPSDDLRLWRDRPRHHGFAKDAGAAAEEGAG
jgi:hypothetical protein